MAIQRRAVFALSISAIIFANPLAFLLSDTAGSATNTIKYGITPYQDTVLPVLAQEMGWYARENLMVQFVNVGWSDVPLGMASGSVDVALYNFDSFMSSWPALREAGKELVFYAPMYVWNGAAIMVKGDGALKPVGDLTGLSAAQRAERIKASIDQLKGKKIALTRGTTFEQTVLDALRVGGLSPKDVEIINARPEDALAAFLSGGVDAFSAGLTERIQAQRHGAVPLVVGTDVSLPVIDGLITTRDFANGHDEELQKLVDLFFESVRYVAVDPAGRSKVLRDYLRGKASVDYSPEEYAIAWTFQHFSSSREEAVSDFLHPDSRYYWKPIWQANSKFLVDEQKIKEPIPLTAFLGEETLPKAK